MIVKDLVNKLMQYVREGELCSCPIIMCNENKVELAVFTYLLQMMCLRLCLAMGSLLNQMVKALKRKRRNSSKVRMNLLS